MVAIPLGKKNTTTLQWGRHRCKAPGIALIVNEVMRLLITYLYADDVVLVGRSMDNFDEEGRGGGGGGGGGFSCPSIMFCKEDRPEFYA